MQVSRDVVGCLAPRTCLDLRLKPTQRKRSDDFGKGPVVIGTNEGLRRAHAHSQKKGEGAEPVKGDVKRPGWGGGLTL